MRGKGPICLRLANHTFHEHDSLESARREAHRLADQTQSSVVVYMPVLLMTPPAKSIQHYLLTHGELTELEQAANDDLPF